MGVRQILSYHEKLQSPELVYKGSHMTPAKKGDLYRTDGPLYVYELKEPWGVTFLVDTYRVLDRKAALDMLWLKTERPWMHGEVILEEEPQALAVAAQPVPAAGTQPSSRVVSESYSRTTVKVTAPSAMFLVVSMIHRPWWHATIDDRPVPVHRAYGGLLCVRVPPGESVVRLLYRPTDVYVGLCLTASAFMVPVGLFWLRRRRAAATKQGLHDAAINLCQQLG